MCMLSNLLKQEECMIKVWESSSSKLNVIDQVNVNEKKSLIKDQKQKQIKSGSSWWWMRMVFNQIVENLHTDLANVV